MRTPPLARRVNTTHPYTPAVATDIRKTFARVRRKLAARDIAAPPYPLIASSRPFSTQKANHEQS